MKSINEKWNAAFRAGIALKDKVATEPGFRTRAMIALAVWPVSFFVVMAVAEFGQRLAETWYGALLADLNSNDPTVAGRAASLMMSTPFVAFVLGIVPLVLLFPRGGRRK